MGTVKDGSGGGKAGRSSRSLLYSAIGGIVIAAILMVWNPAEGILDLAIGATGGIRDWLAGIRKSRSYLGLYLLAGLLGAVVIGASVEGVRSWVSRLHGKGRTG